MTLPENHPDFGVKTGTKKDDGTGLEWQFFSNQYCTGWTLPNKHGSFTCEVGGTSLGEGYPYRADGQLCKSWAKAANRAIAQAKREYDKAVILVAAYDQGPTHAPTS